MKAKALHRCSAKEALISVQIFWLWLLAWTLPSVSLGAVRSLDGPWEFYWQRQLSFQERATPDIIIPHLKGPWNQLVLPDGQRLPANGFATYRLELTDLPYRPDGYQLLLSNLVGAYQLDVSDAKTDQLLSRTKLGQVGPETGIEPSLSASRLIPIQSPKHGHVRITLQVANHRSYYGGGLWKPPLLDDGMHLRRLLFIDAGRDMLCIGVFLTIGLFNAVIWLRRRHDWAPILVSGVAVFLLTRTLGTSPVLCELLSDLWQIPILRRLEYLSLCLTFTVPLYNAITFEHSARRLRWVTALTIVQVLSAAWLFLSSLDKIEALLPYFQGLVLCALIMSIYFSLGSWKAKSVGSSINLVGMVLACVFTLWDIIVVTLWKYNDIYLGPVAGVFYLLAQAQVIAQRTAIAQKQAINLAAENARRQVVLRNESEELLKLAARAAHNVNNPLNMIQLGLSQLEASWRFMKGFTHSLLGDDATDDPSQARLRETTETHLKSLAAHYDAEKQCLQSMARAIAEFRGFSGIDGFGTEMLSLEKLAQELHRKLEQRYSQDQVASLKLMSEQTKSTVFFGNYYLSLYVWERILELCLQHARSPLLLTWGTLGDRDGLHLEIGGLSAIPKPTLREVEDLLSLLLSRVHARLSLEQNSDKLSVSYQSFGTQKFCALDGAA